MTGRDLRSFVGAVHCFRPLATVVLAVALVLPSFFELASGNLSAVTLLGRLALALPVCAALVWGVSGIVLRYARIQAAAQAENERIRRAHADFDR